MDDILENNVSNVMGITVLEKGRGKKMTREIISRNCTSELEMGDGKFRDIGFGICRLCFQAQHFFY